MSLNYETGETDKYYFLLQGVPSAQFLKST